MRVLVTGGAGFIGSAVVGTLMSRGGVQVLNIDKLTYAGDIRRVAKYASAAGYQFVKADIADAETLSEAFREFRPDTVIHLAAETHVDRSIVGPDAFIQTNIVGTSVLLTCALTYWQNLVIAERERFRFLHVSTDEVFGSLDSKGFFTENSPYQPNSPYAASKASADHLVRAFNRTYGLPTLLTNCSNNYGPHQFPEKLLPRVIRMALRGDKLPVYGKGLQIRDWIHVEDHVAAILCVLERGQPGENFLVGARQEIRNIDLVKLVCAILDEMIPDLPYGPHANLISFVDDRPGHDLRYAIDPTKIETRLGWRPKISFKHGINDTVSWYVANRSLFEDAQPHHV